ncbi:MAG: SRPBCC family protein [Gammaproteobacteria bacterium]
MLQKLTGVALGAAAMYIFDPDKGRRRRALLRDQLVSGAIHLDDAVEVIARDFANRAQGLLAQARAMVKREPISDEVLVPRVRAKLGRIVSHPSAIDVKADQGRVSLSGRVLRHEHQHLLKGLRSVRGVTSVEDSLEVHASAEGVSALQGGRTRNGDRFELLQENWAPAARALVGAAGGALVLHALRSRNPLGLLTGSAGSALLLRSVLNRPMKQMVGRRAIDIRKTLNVNVPIEKVFDTLTHYENFPRFMSNVREVTMHEDGSSHWKVAGPAGQSVEWDAVTTELIPREIVAWKTKLGSPVEHSGSIRLEAVDHGTRLEVKMSYNPPGGAIGHRIAALFGADPKTELDADLLRMKTFLETGHAARDAAVRH